MGNEYGSIRYQGRTRSSFYEAWGFGDHLLYLRSDRIVVLGGKLIQRKILPRKTEDKENFSKYDWDDIFPPELRQDWETRKKTLSDLHNLKLPRCLIPNTFETEHSSINVFTDASEDAIGHVIYLKSTDNAGKSHVAFLYGESKSAPKSANSIPRLNCVRQPTQQIHLIR